MSQRYSIRLAEPTDSPALLKLINDTPQQGRIQLNFERQPDFFHATHIVTHEAEVWLMEDKQKDRLAASFSIGKREVYVQGKKRLTRYGNDLRIHNEYKGGRTLFRLFKKYKELMQDEWMQTVILDENKASIDTVSSGRLSLPTYHCAGRFITHMIALNKRYPVAPQSIRRAHAEDIPSMQVFFDHYGKEKEFFPCYDFSKIDSDDAYYRNLSISDYFLYFQGGELLGVVGSWNQKAFKQTRFISYHGRMKLLRHVNNITSQLLGGMRLPPAGELANYISLHSILIKNNQSELLKDMLLKVLSEYKESEFDALILGFDERDPLHKALKKFKSHTLISNHYIASYGHIPEYLDPKNDYTSEKLFYLEPSRL